ncbi:MAG: ssl1498 family light-harvesting-like protein [Microcoleaceae cyanobacterium]
MPYTTEEGGRLNNFAVEPKVYQADAPDQKQQMNYLVLGALAVLLIGGLVFVAVSVSA